MAACSAIAFGLAALSIAPTAQAHEVLPTIGDVEVVGDALTFRLEGNFESIVAGIDLEGLDNTEAAPEAVIYDSLRALGPEAFGQRLLQHWPEISQKIEVVIDGTLSPLTLTGIDVPPAGNVEIARLSVLSFSTPLPEAAEALQFGCLPNTAFLCCVKWGSRPVGTAIWRGAACRSPLRSAAGMR